MKLEWRRARGKVIGARSVIGEWVRPQAGFTESPYLFLVCCLVGFFAKTPSHTAL